LQIQKFARVFAIREIGKEARARFALRYQSYGFAQSARFASAKGDRVAAQAAISHLGRGRLGCDVCVAYQSYGFAHTAMFALRYQCSVCAQSAMFALLRNANSTELRQQLSTQGKGLKYKGFPSEGKLSR